MGFLDNLKGKLEQGADRVKFETDKLQRTGRLRNEVGDLQQQIATNFGQLGQRAYELHNEGKISAPEVASLVQVINDLQARLGGTQAELERAQAEQFVAQPQQQAYGDPNQHNQQAYPQQQPYPQQEGAPPAPQAVDAGQYACPSCGYKLPAGSAFCPECGARVGA